MDSSRKAQKSDLTWKDLKLKLGDLNRIALMKLIHDLYTADRDNQIFLHTRFGLGKDLLGPYKSTISYWINPDILRTYP